jgi:hypothetical protein
VRSGQVFDVIFRQLTNASGRRPTPPPPPPQIQARPVVGATSIDGTDALFAENATTRIRRNGSAARASARSPSPRPTIPNARPEPSTSAGMPDTARRKPRSMIRHIAEAPDLRRVVVAIDPAVSSGDASALTGIVVAAVGVDGRGRYVRTWRKLTGWQPSASVRNCPRPSTRRRAPAEGAGDEPQRNQGRY